MTSRSQPSGASKNAAPKYATTAAGDWFDARLKGQHLPQHALPDDPEERIWTQRQEQQP